MKRIVVIAQYKCQSETRPLINVVEARAEFLSNLRTVAPRMNLWHEQDAGTAMRWDISKRIALMRIGDQTAREETSRRRVIM